MLISRCAWHPRNYGHAKLLRVTSWRGLRFEFTDGICPKCAARIQVAVRRGDVGPPRKSNAGQTSEIIVVALAVTTGLVLIARPTNDTPPPLGAASLPRAVAVAQAPAPERPVQLRAQRPRPSRGPAAASRVRPAPPALQSP